MTKEELKAKLQKATPEERAMLADALDLDPAASKSDVLKTLAALVEDVKALKEKSGEAPPKPGREDGRGKSLFDEIFS